MRALALCVGLLILAGPTAAAEPARADWPLRLAQPYDYGVFREDVGSATAEERLRGDVADPVVPTSYVPAREGVLFGIRYTVVPPPERLQGRVPVTLLYITPGIVDPVSGGLRHRIEIAEELDLSKPTHVMAFKFSEPGELAPGPWHFFVFQGDVLVVSHTFVVVP